MELRWYQREAVDATWSSLRADTGNPVICLPTGSGKSVVIAELCRVAVEQWDGRVMVLAHRKELIGQNARKIRAMLPAAMRLGIHSAGLGQRDTDEQVLCGGIQSLWRKASELGERNLCIIDEAHLVPHDGEGMYRSFLNDLRGLNPGLRVVGLTATPYRTDCGSLCKKTGLFQRICYDAPIQRLIAEGYLSPVTNKPAENAYDASGLHVRGGEFIASEVSRLFDDARKIDASCREIVALSTGRKSVLVFCAGIWHAEHVADSIRSLTGEDVGLVTGDSTSIERAGVIESFEARRLRWLVNVDVLTTGFDAPCVDAIAILRSTASPGLFAQICGRGLRLFDDKRDCLILDFGQNIERHGPIDAIDFGKRSVAIGDGGGDAPKKTCPGCEEEVPAGLRECECGFQFPPPKLPHGVTADTSSQVLAEPETWDVVTAEVSRHQKKKAPAGTPDTFRVDWVVVKSGATGNLGTREETVSEWVCIEHQGFARRKACEWWAMHSLAPCPASIDEAIELFMRGAVAFPLTLTTIKEGYFRRVTSRTMPELPSTWADTADDPFASREVF